MAPFLKRLSSHGFIPAMLLASLAVLLTFGFFIPRLGFYHDDWYMIWSGISRGPGSLFALFTSDRPFIGFIYVRLFAILRDNLLAWQLVSLAARITGAGAFYWILSLAWPKLKNLFGLAVVLFIMFPGFLSLPNAATKINHLIGYGAALFSIAFTLQAAVTGRKALKLLWVGLAVITLAVYLWIYEYMLGLEIMRVTLLFWLYWQASRPQTRAALKNTLMGYLVYLPVIFAFLYWRFNIFESTRPATNAAGLLTNYGSDFMSMLLRLGVQVMKDFAASALFAWFVQPYHLLAQADFGRIIIALLSAAGVVVLTAGYTFTAKNSQSSEDKTSAPIWLIAIGSLITLGAVFPVVLANRNLDLLDPYKSYGLHPSAGAIIILLGVVMLLKPSARRIALITILGLSVMTQSLNVQDWAYYWEIQKNFWWQLTWRAPAIGDNTLVMGAAPARYGFQQDYEVWGPINLIYHPEREMAPRIHSEVLNPETSALIYGKRTFPMLYVRDIFLPRDYNNILIISQPTAQACIHVIDGKMPAYSVDEHLIVQQMGGYSNIDFINPLALPPVPPASIFGQEPAHTWCYYYQQAALARQTGDWRRIGDLYDTALAAGFKAQDPAEYFPFIEGLVNTNRVAEARELVDSHILDNEALRLSFCRSLSAAPAYPAAYGYRYEEINQLLCERRD